MSRWPIVVAVAIFAFSSGSTHPLEGQGVGGYPYNYSPPPLSPWLSLYQKQGGPLDPYHTFVQPQLQLQSTLQAQQIGIQRNAAGVENVTSQIQEINGAPVQTGMGANFMNHGVYFNTNRQPGLGLSGTAGTSATTAGRGAVVLPAANNIGYGGGEIGNSIPSRAGR